MLAGDFRFAVEVFPFQEAFPHPTPYHSFHGFELNFEGEHGVLKQERLTHLDDLGVPTVGAGGNDFTRFVV